MHSLREKYHYEMNELERELTAMGQLVDTAIQRAFWALEQQALGEARQIVKDDEQVDLAEEDLHEHALKIMALQSPVATELRLVSGMLACSRELERIGDYAKGVAALTLRLAELPPVTLPTQMADMQRDVRKMLAYAFEALAKRDATCQERLNDMDDEVDQSYDQAFAAIVRSMEQDSTNILAGTYLLWILHNLERIGDRINNIGEEIEYIVKGQVTTHKTKSPHFDLAEPPDLPVV